MQPKRIALLIDCDNVSHTAIEGVLEELAKYGMVNVRHAHGDWKSENLSGWMEKLHPFAIRPMQQFAYAKGKNATDSAMIIDAMDLLYSKSIDAFALMTSDSDFTPSYCASLRADYPSTALGRRKHRNHLWTHAHRLSMLKTSSAKTTRVQRSLNRRRKPGTNSGVIRPWCAC